MRLLSILVVLSLFPFGNTMFSQPTKVGGDVNYLTQNTYTIAGIVVVGTITTDPQAIKAVAGLQEGQEVTVPGEKISQAIKNLWRQHLFSEIEIDIAEIREKDVYLVIKVKELPRLFTYNFKGMRKTEEESVREDLGLYKGLNINEDIKRRAVNTVEEYFVDKGFLNAVATITESNYNDSLGDRWKKLTINLNKGNRIKINEIIFAGTENLTDYKLKRALKETKEKRVWSLFKSSKFIAKEFEAGKDNIIVKYNNLGFRNTVIVSDSIVKVDDKLINLYITIDEDKKFYFRNISYTGNTKYATSKLDSIVNIHKGEVYDVSKLEARLYANPRGLDVTSLYQDQGYLNFYAYPIETLIESDSIDIEVRMNEGKEYRYGKITVVGNTKTNDHVIYREIRTRPGEIFSRSDIIRTQRELAQLGYFDPQQFQVNPTQNPQEGTVDIEYVVAEKPSDQITLSGGFGGNRVVGSAGLTFTNFSLRNFFKNDAWRPLPSGDGQRLSLRGYTNGATYSSLNFSFVEPWLGGKKPTSLSFSVYKTLQANGVKKIDGEPNPDRGTFKIFGTSISIGKKFKRPDDWFLGYLGLSYQHYTLNKYGAIFNFDEDQGTSNNLSFTGSLQRNSVSAPIYPTWGSDIKFSAKTTLPYSMFDGVDDYSGYSDQEKYKWVEYYKLKFTAKWHTSLFTHKMGEEGEDHSIVLATGAGLGYVGSYSKSKGISPFELFEMGGLPLTGFSFEAREIISLRGYEDFALSRTQVDGGKGAPVVAKYNMELRYPLSTNPNAYIYVLSFLEAGQVWGNPKKVDPFNLKRSGGFGMRIFMPMFGLIGLDYGWPFDTLPGQAEKGPGQFHFSIGMNLGEL